MALKHIIFSLIAFVGVGVVIGVAIWLKFRKTYKWVQTPGSQEQATILCGSTPAERVSNAGKTVSTPVVCIDESTQHVVSSSLCTDPQPPPAVTYVCPGYEWEINDFIQRQ